MNHVIHILLRSTRITAVMIAALQCQVFPSLPSALSSDGPARPASRMKTRSNASNVAVLGTQVNAFDIVAFPFMHIRHTFTAEWGASHSISCLCLQGAIKNFEYVSMAGQKARRGLENCMEASTVFQFRCARHVCFLTCSIIFFILFLMCLLLNADIVAIMSSLSSLGLSNPPTRPSLGAKDICNSHVIIYLIHEIMPNTFLILHLSYILCMMLHNSICLQPPAATGHYAG